MSAQNQSKPNVIDEQKTARETQKNDWILIDKYRQQLRNEFMENARRDLMRKCEAATVIVRERNERIRIMQEETTRFAECFNEYIDKVNDHFASISLAHSYPSIDVQHLLESFKREFRNKFNTFIEEFHFDKVHTDDLIRNASHQFALDTTKHFKLFENDHEMELLKRITAEEDEFEKELIKHNVSMTLMEREREELKEEIKMIRSAENVKDGSHNEKERLINEIKVLQNEIDEIRKQIQNCTQTETDQ